MVRGAGGLPAGGRHARQPCRGDATPLDRDVIRFAEVRSYLW